MLPSHRALFALLQASLLAGCLGVSKRQGAIHAADVPKGLKAVANFARALEQQSSLARSSGEVTYLRLAGLFPRAADNSIKEVTFSLMGGSGLTRVFGQLERPSSAMAQLALREQSATLCKAEISDAGQDLSRIFSFGGADGKGILLTDLGETEPADPAVRAGLAAARNVWLDLYTPSSPEVRELADVYRKILTVTSSELEAKRAVCVTALIAPQFWMGNPTTTDPLRRIALELGRRLPTFRELSDFQRGRITAAAYVDLIQKEPGYFKAVRAWHQEWLGLRPYIFLPDTSDVRADQQTGGWGGPSLLSGLRWEDNGSRIYPNGLVWGTAQVCDTGKLQTFDPRTTMVVWEHRNTSLPGEVWDFTGGWIRTEFKSSMLTYLTSTYGTRIPGFNAETVYRQLCHQLLNPSPANSTTAMGADSTAQGWVRCDGLLDLRGASPQGGTYGQNLKDYLDAAQGRIDAITDPKLQWKKDNINGERNEVRRRVSVFGWQSGQVPSFYLTHLSDIIPALSGGGRYPYGRLSMFAQNDWEGLPLHVPLQPGHQAQDGFRRARRFSPSGEQDGYSNIRLWYSGIPHMVCNSIERFYAACFYRHGENTYATNSPIQSSYWYGSYAGLAAVGEGYIVTDAAYHPAVLDQFTCGKVTASQITSAPGGTYSKGYTGQTFSNPDPPDPNGLNDLASMITIIGAKGAEHQATSRLFNDLHDEPYYLLQHLLDNDRPYTELLTADYTCGGKELELLYRTRAYHLAVRPEEYDTEFTQPKPPCGPNRHIFRITRGLSTRLIRASDGSHARSGGEVHAFKVPEEGGQGDGFIPPKVMSGILTMPALLGPVSPKMRTVAARYFQRMMCGDPNLFVPTGSQVTLHSKYISKRQHLAQPCFMCHVNLDPLAAALSASFVVHEGNTGSEGIGEMHLMNFGGNYESAVYGVRGGGPKGEGALLGQAVSGVREVGEVLSKSREFARCVVQKNFENVFGRSPAMEDMKFVNEIVASFMTHYSFNRLVKELVTSPNFMRRN